MSSETTYDTSAVVLSLVIGVILSANHSTRMVLNASAGSTLDRFGTHRPMPAGFLLKGLVPRTWTPTSGGDSIEEATFLPRTTVLSSPRPLRDTLSIHMIY
ncbi:hypothetical protein [Halococcus sp. IIIV-5B]|uniref:hypothetical protein n=1 Tax=Halococcus sp. IIIV-5B TaxID=2321230 RepID=UPI001F43C162|nr:hypothetical protein [Halococcus sp. IIIV-5B]